MYYIGSEATNNGERAMYEGYYLERPSLEAPEHRVTDTGAGLVRNRPDQPDVTLDRRRERRAHVAGPDTGPATDGRLAQRESTTLTS